MTPRLAEQWRRAALTSSILSRVPDGWEARTSEQPNGSPWRATVARPDGGPLGKDGAFIYYFGADTEEEALRGLLVRVSEL